MSPGGCGPAPRCWPKTPTGPPWRRRPLTLATSHTSRTGTGPSRPALTASWGRSLSICRRLPSGPRSSFGVRRQRARRRLATSCRGDKVAFARSDRSGLACVTLDQEKQELLCLALDQDRIRTCMRHPGSGEAGVACVTLDQEKQELHASPWIRTEAGVACVTLDQDEVSLRPICCPPRPSEPVSVSQYAEGRPTARSDPDGVVLSRVRQHQHGVQDEDRLHDPIGRRSAFGHLSPFRCPSTPTVGYGRI